MSFSTLDQPLYAAEAELFRALGHPARIRILELLVESEQSVSSLLTELDSSHPRFPSTWRW